MTFFNKTSTAILGVLCLLILFIQFISHIKASSQPMNTIYQVAPIAALAKGVDDGTYTYGELKKHGNFGLGTFSHLDGEMIALDDKFYQMMENGQVKPVENKQVVPFAEVTYFHPTIKQMQLQPNANLGTMSSNLLSLFKNKNVPYSIRIDGTFSYLKLRAVRKQTTPYKSLAEAAKNQAIFNLRDVKGIIIGFWFPEYLTGVAVTGFHLHFIDSNHKIGGHILDLNMQTGTLSMEQMSGLQLYFPDTASFANAQLADKSVSDIINHAEKNH